MKMTYTYNRANPFADIFEGLPPDEITHQFESRLVDALRARYPNDEVKVVGNDVGVRDVDLYEVSNSENLELEVGLEIKRIAGRVRDEIAIELRRFEALRARDSERGD